MKIRDRIRELRRVPASELRPNPKNWRTHPEAQANALRGLLAEVGIADAVLAREDEDGSLILLDGHLRVETMGGEILPVLVLDVDEDEGNKILATLDPLAAMAEADAEKLDAILREIDTDSPDVKEMLSGLAEEAGLNEEEDREIVEDEVPEPPADPITKPGDLWILGDHRLLCGDSTKAEDVERLMAGARAESVMTDPPYGMSYKGKVFGKDGLANDGEGEFEKVLTDAVVNLPAADAAVAICFSPSRLDGYFRATSALNFHRLLTIYKPNRMGYPWRGWILTSEVVGIFSVGSPSWGDGPACHDVYVFKYEDRPDRSIDHPTVKPLKIIADILEKLGGASVYDPFLGSGTTLIAAEQLGRKCYGMEISPAYCDVIVKRWETLTGKKAKLESSPEKPKAK